MARAKAELGVTVPVYRAEAVGDGLRLWLYGSPDGKPVIWTPRAGQAKPEPIKAKQAKKVKHEAQ